QASHRLELDGHVLQALSQVGEVAGEGQHVELLLGGEVAVDERLVDPHCARDALDRSILEAAFVEQEARGGDDLPLPLAPARSATGRDRLLVTGHAGHDPDYIAKVNAVQSCI